MIYAEFYTKDNKGLPKGWEAMIDIKCGVLMLTDGVSLCYVDFYKVTAMDDISLMQLKAVMKIASDHKLKGKFIVVSHGPLMGLRTFK